MNKSKNINSVGGILLRRLSQNMVMTKLLQFNRRFIVAMTEWNRVNQWAATKQRYLGMNSAGGIPPAPAV